MTQDTIKVICDAIEAEPFEVIREIASVESVRNLDAFILTEYMGTVTLLGMFYLPSDAQKFASQKAMDQPTWKVVLVRKLADGSHLVYRVTTHDFVRC